MFGKENNARIKTNLGQQLQWGKEKKKLKSYFRKQPASDPEQRTIDYI